MNISLIEKDIDLGYISKKKHPELDLYILNYTNQATIDWYWDDATKLCRGLIVDSNYNIVHRSYYKFFDIEQIETTKCDDDWHDHSDEEFIIAHKKDGFLGIMYVNKSDSDKINHYSNMYPSSDMAIATRGSFTSDMAIRATEILHSKYKNVMWDSNYTYNFEIIYPNDILTIDYGYEDLVLHGVFDNKTGKEIWLHEFEHYDYLKKIGVTMELPVEQGKGFYGIEEFYKRYKFNEDEGYVISFRSGYKIKVKFDEYKAMSRAKRSFENFNSKSFIEHSLDGTADKLLESNPNILNKTRRDAIQHVKDEYDNLYTSYKNKLENINLTDTRDLAIYCDKHCPEDKSILILFHLNKEDKIKNYLTKKIINNIECK